MHSSLNYTANITYVCTVIIYNANYFLGMMTATWNLMQIIFVLPDSLFSQPLCFVKIK